MNEYNAVGSTKYRTTVVGDPTNGVDSYFGRVLGNGGDWWINAHTFNNPTYFTTTTNKTLDISGNFSVGNNNWLMEIRNATNALVTAGCGEGGASYGGSGVSSTEVCKLEAQPAANISNALFDDGDNSSFGSPNSWKDAIFVTCKVRQDFAALGEPTLAECATCKPIFLNEYNAVMSTGYLNGGTATVDADGGASADTHFGVARCFCSGATRLWVHLH